MTKQATKTLDGIVRVSKKGSRGGDSFISPTEQQKAIRAWIAEHPGYELGKLHEEIDVSGKSGSRSGRASRPRCAGSSRATPTA